MSPRHMGLQADRFSSDIRGFEGLLHKNKGNIKSVEPKIIKLHSQRVYELFTATDTEYICVKHRISVMYL